MIKKLLIFWGTMVAIVLIGMILCFQIIPRMQTRASSENIEEDEAAEFLDVYMFGDSILNSVTGEELNQSCFTLGEFTERSQIWGNEGHLYYAAVEEFERETSMEVRVSYFLTTSAILEQLKLDAEQSSLPDVIVGSYTSEDYDLAPFLWNDFFCDLTPFFEEDEVMSGGNYVTKVMEAGNINGKQVLFPLTFNMNLLMTSEEVLRRHNFPLLKDYSYDEMIDVFTQEWSNQGRENDEILLLQFSDMWNTYPYSLFDGASGISYLDFETQEVTLDQEYFYQLTELYKAYLCDDFTMSQEELKQNVAQSNQGLPYKDSKYEKTTALIIEEILDGFDYVHERAVYIADGGTQGFSLHSFAAQAGYYESRYKENNEEFVCMAVPMKENQNEYAAIVTTFGAVLNDSQHTRKGYQFLKQLADSDHFMYMDLSVNQDRISDTFDALTGTEFDFYPAQGKFPPEDVPEGQDWLGDCYTIKPMSKETSLYLQDMIEHIGVTTLPQGLARQVVRREAERYIYGDVDSMEEAYQNAVEALRRSFIVL